MLHLNLQYKGLKSILKELAAEPPQGPILQPFVKNFDGEAVHTKFK